MTIVGEGFVAITPLATGFAAATEKEVEASNFAGKLESSLGNAGVLGGEKFTKGFKSQLSTLGIQNEGLAIGGALVIGVTAALAEIGEQFAKARHQIEEETGAAGKTLDKLAAETTQAFREVPVSLSAAATAVDELFRRGTPVGPLLDQLAEKELFLAKITKSDLATNVESTTALFAKFGIEAHKQSNELDVLFKAAQHSGLSFATLVSSLQSGATSLSQFGFSLDQSAAFLATLGKAGVTIGPTLAALKLALGKVIAAGQDPKQAIAKMFREFTDGTPKAKAASDALALLGKRGGTELVTALARGTVSLAQVKKTLNELTNGNGGIVETGLSTLTLGDQFKLLRNNIEADLSGAGTAVLQDLEHGLEGVATPVEHLITSFAHLGTELVPIATGFGVFLVPLRLIPGLIDDFASGIDAIATGLHTISSPITGVALGVAFLGVAATGAADGLLAASGAATVFGAAIDFATGPIGITIAAIALLGKAVQLFSAHEHQISAEAKSLGDALFDVSQKTSIFKDGIESSASGFAQFLKVNIDTKKVSGDLKDVLKDGGTNLNELAHKAVQGGTAFKTYQEHVLDVVAAHRKFGDGEKELLHDDITGKLKDQGDAFRKAAQDELKNAVAAGQLKQSQVDLAIRTTKNTDGTRNYGAAIDKLNSELLASVKAHDAVVSHAAKTTDVEAKLAKQLASGAITTDDAKAALTQLGLSGPATDAALALVESRATSLNEALDASATKTVPLTGAYGALARAIATGTITQEDATNALHLLGFSADGAKTAFGNLQSQISTFVSTAVGALPSFSDAIQTATDKGKLSVDGFIKDLVAQSTSVLQFQANLQKLVSENFGALAGQLAEQGPKVAGALAKALASDPSKAAVANAAVGLAGATTDKYTKFLTQNFPALALAGQAAGAAVGAGITQGVTAQLLKNFPQLRAAGVQVGATVGKAVGPSLQNSLDTNDLNRILRQHGETAGQEFSSGIGQGITDKSIDVTKAVNAAADGAIAAARKRFHSHSPSLEGVDIGADFVAGIALGITKSTSFATDAASKLAAEITQSVHNAFGPGPIGRRLPTPKPQPPLTAHTSLIGSGQVISGTTPDTRLDALAQQRAVTVKFEQTFNTPVDPLHVASEIAWQLTRRG